MEITKRSVLLDALQREELVLARFSIDGTKLRPRPKFEAAFEEQRERCRLLREMIHALESEPVRRALADWQKEIMDTWPPERMTF